MNLPAWNLESEYPSLESPEFLADESRLAALTRETENQVKSLRPQLGMLDDLSIAGGIQQLLRLNQESTLLRRNLFVYVSCIRSTDARNEAATAKQSQLQSLSSQYSQAFKPVQLYITQCTNRVFEEIMSHPELKGSHFLWTQERIMKDVTLSEKEETLLSALWTDGFESWSNLYSNLSGTIKVQLELNGETKTVGLAEAAGMTRSSVETERKAAWIGVQKAWKEHEESAAAILNSLAGWRLEIYKRRSHSRHVDFMTFPLHQSRIQQQTLNAMMTAVENNKQDIQQAAFLMARMLGKKKLDPWDTLAPAPIAKASGKTDFEQAIRYIREAFEGVNPDFGSFVDRMVQNHWIEGRVLPNKTTGAYCTSFPKSRTPRVFQTYLGSNNDISTLAHELGHAYHSWTIRELPMDQQNYPMTLAETASIFAETVLTDIMIERAKTREEKIDFAWSNVESAVNLLLNIPARYEFETHFYQKRKERKLSARELSEITDQAWSKWYGPTLSENDKMFWASKLHFSMSSTSFYNYPYTFGYLFALSIYARRSSLGSQFWPQYTEILKDTGRMTAEDLVQKHFNEDIRNPEFWQKAIDVVKSKIKDFEKLV